jgi:hypothetical protein
MANKHILHTEISIFYFWVVRDAFSEKPTSYLRKRKGKGKRNRNLENTLGSQKLFRVTEGVELNEIQDINELSTAVTTLELVAPKWSKGQ